MRVGRYCESRSGSSTLGHRARILAACVLGSVAASAPAAHAAGATATRVAGATLSNETTRSTWSVADIGGPIYAFPTSRSAKVAKLQFLTPDGFLQSYLLLREQWNSQGIGWVKLRIPGRPNGRVGWVPRSDLDVFHRTNMELVVDRAAEHVTLYRSGRQIFQAPVGVGKPSTPTPSGHFWITEAFGGFDNPAYGPYVFGTADYSVLSEWPGGGIVGMHGTDEPWLVPGDPSHGCIRMHNSDILTLASLLGNDNAIGTPLLVK